MINFLELAERSHSGEAIDKETWDLDHIAIPVTEIVQKYQLTWNREELIPTDRDLLQRYYQAGRELLIDSGVYNISTGRVIKLTEDEIDGGAANHRQSLIMGSGKETFELYARKPEDPRKPAVFGGNPGCPTPEKIFYATARSWAQEKSVDLLTCGSMVDVDGFPVRLGEATEVLAVRRELDCLNRASADAGRPGMGRLGAESAVSEVGDLASCAPGFLNRGDSHLVALNNELIINRDNLVRAASSFHTGVSNSSLACVMVEGLSGGAPGATVVMIASILAANLVCAADYHLCHPIHLRHIATSTRECMWVQNVVCQAFDLCAPAIIVCDIYPKSGAMTKELLYETAANALAITVSGGHLEGVGSCDGLKPHGTGVEARVMGETGRFASRSGVTREAANKMLRTLLNKYEYVFEKGNPGLPFEEAYDLASVTPKPEWIAMYEEVRQDLKSIGIILT
jgi:methylamine--corrinoid protein Co-methyltransferase